MTPNITYNYIKKKLHFLCFMSKEKEKGETDKCEGNKIGTEKLDFIQRKPLEGIFFKFVSKQRPGSRFLRFSSRPSISHTL